MCDSGGKGTVLWTCVCDCGTRKDVFGSDLRSGKSTCCGCSRRKNITGRRFGNLVAVRNVGSANGNASWNCQCDCGKEITTSTKSLISGNTQSCGCLRIRDLSKQRFGKLVVTERTVERTNESVVWLCLCDCGKYAKVSSNNLTMGNTKSCGCSQHPRGAENHRYNPNLTDEERVNGRGNDHRVWSHRILSRDNYTCKICGKSPSGNLNAHHLNGWNKFTEQRFDLENGVTLCTDCHNEFHDLFGRGNNTHEQFIEYSLKKVTTTN